MAMNERLHRVLDGELDRDALTGAERRELEALEAMLSDLPLEPQACPDLSAGVMARVEQLEAERARSARPGILHWLWAPRPVSFTLRPATLLAAAAALAILLVLPLDPRTGGPAPEDSFVEGAPATGEAGEEPAAIFVHFRLDAPQATRVSLAGDFTEWQPELELFEQYPGVWSVVVPLAPGVHDYAFVIDGQRWVPDPLGIPVDDGFGGTNSRLSLLPPEGSRAL
ncbi:MAG TPA: glycogen-binding domain-containing protein [Longimicrobiales bacterium]|nr:glycogen-binding domain-containing protein [Longimicrobiales bacterium]